eukprot:6354302-Prorocentrum_lima.AAC.1
MGYWRHLCGGPASPRGFRADTQIAPIAMCTFPGPAPSMHVHCAYASAAPTHMHALSRPPVSRS